MLITTPPCPLTLTSYRHQDLLEFKKKKRDKIGDNDGLQPTWFLLTIYNTSYCEKSNIRRFSRKKKWSIIRFIDPFVLISVVAEKVLLFKTFLFLPLYITEEYDESYFQLRTSFCFPGLRKKTKSIQVHILV